MKKFLIKILIVISFIAVVFLIILIYSPINPVNNNQHEIDSLNNRVLYFENIVKENSIFVDSVIKMKLYTDSILIVKESQVIKLKKQNEKDHNWNHNTTIDSTYEFINGVLSAEPEREY